MRLSKQYLLASYQLMQKAKRVLSATLPLGVLEALLEHIAALEKAGDELHDDLVLFHSQADVIPKWTALRTGFRPVP